MQTTDTMQTFRSLLFLLLLLTAALPARAAEPFSGVMEMLLEMPGGRSEITYHLGRSAQRMDMFVQMNRLPDPLRTSVITRSSRPDEARILNHRDRSWSEVNLRAAAEEAMMIDFDNSYRLEKLGKATIKGYPCQHIRLTTSNESIEFWMTRSLGAFSTFRLLQSQNPRLSNTALSKALADAGVDGFPVRMVQKNQNGTYRMELVQVWPKPVENSTFSIPSGYRKVDHENARLSDNQKAHLKNLMEKMKKFER